MLTSPKPRDGLEDMKYREKETFNDGFVRSGVWWLQQVIYSLTHRSLRPNSSLAEYSESVTQSCPALLRPHGLHNPWNSSEQNTGVGSLSLLQGIFPTQELNWGSPALQADSLPTELSGKPHNLPRHRLSFIISL